MWSATTTSSATTGSGNIDVSQNGVCDIEAPQQVPSITGAACEATTTTTSTVENNNGNTGNSNSLLVSNFIVRMYVMPFSPLLKYRVTPTRYQKKIPSPPLQQQQQKPSFANGTTTTGSTPEQQQEHIDEWNHIWQRVSDFLGLDTTIQEAKRKNLMYLCFCTTLFLMIFYLLVGGMELFSRPKLRHTTHEQEVEKNTWYFIAGMVIFGIVACTVQTYMKHGDPNRTIRSSAVNELYTTSSRTKYLILLGIAYLITFLTAEDGDWNWSHVFVVIPLCVGLMYISYIVLCIPFLLSCRNCCYHFFDGNDKAMRMVYYEVKNINNELIYFTVHPKVDYVDCKIVVDVYYKKNTNDDSNGNNNSSTGSNGLVSPTLSLTSPLSAPLGVCQRRGGNNSINESQQPLQGEELRNVTTTNVSDDFDDMIHTTGKNDNNNDMLRTPLLSLLVHKDTTS